MLKAIEFDYSGREISIELPSGYTYQNCAIISAMYYLSSNSSWTLLDITNTNIRFNINKLASHNISKFINMNYRKIHK